MVLKVMDDYLTHLERIGGCFNEEDIEEPTCDECGDTVDRCKCPKRLLFKADQLIIKLSQLVYKDAIADHLPYGLKDEVTHWLRNESGKVER